MMLIKEVCDMSENYQPDVKLDENPNGTVSLRIAGESAAFSLSYSLI